MAATNLFFSVSKMTEEDKENKVLESLAGAWNLFLELDYGDDELREAQFHFHMLLNAVAARRTFRDINGSDVVMVASNPQHFLAERTDE